VPPLLFSRLYFAIPCQLPLIFCYVRENGTASWELGLASDGLSGRDSTTAPGEWSRQKKKLIFYIVWKVYTNTKVLFPVYLPHWLMCLLILWFLSLTFGFPTSSWRYCCSSRVQVLQECVLGNWEILFKIIIVVSFCHFLSLYPLLLFHFLTITWIEVCWFCSKE